MLTQIFLACVIAIILAALLMAYPVLKLLDYLSRREPPLVSAPLSDYEDE
jgi:hypothetical protein